MHTFPVTHSIVYYFYYIWIKNVACNNTLAAKNKEPCISLAVAPAKELKTF